jgi:dTDP-4-amino-4,6-dideoxygalactose transaminase
MYVVGKPNIANWKKFRERIEKIKDSQILTNDGPFVRELEIRIEQFIGRKCLAVCNATIAIELVLRALELDGEHAITIPSFTFIATAHAITSVRSYPNFVDIDKNSLCMLPNRMSGRAAIPVDIFGGCGNIEEYEENAYITTIYDSAHSLGSRYKGIPMGGFGKASIFSLHATKCIQGFEGGLICTDDEELLNSLRLMRNFGFNSSPKVHGELRGWGTNAKMSEVHAAMALTNFENMEVIIEKNTENYNLYSKYLPDSCQIFKFGSHISPNYSYVPVFSTKRDLIVDYLYERGCFARKYFTPCHKVPPYTYWRGNLENTEEISNSIFCLPTGLSIKEPDIKKICKWVSEV